MRQRKRRATPRELSGALALVSFLFILSVVGGYSQSAMSTGQFIADMIFAAPVLYISTKIYERSE